MSGETQAATDLISVLLGGGGAVTGAGGLFILQRVLGNKSSDAPSPAMQELSETAIRSSSKLDSIDNGINQLNITMAKIEGALSQRHN